MSSSPPQDLTDTDLANFIILAQKLEDLRLTVEGLSDSYFTESIALSSDSRRLASCGKMLDDLLIPIEKHLLIIKACINVDPNHSECATPSKG